MSLCSKATRDESTVEMFQTRLYQAWQRDWDNLDTLKFDKRRNEGVIGLNSLRNYLLELTWKSFKDIIPEFRKQLSQLKKSSQDNLQRIQDLYSG